MRGHAKSFSSCFGFLYKLPDLCFSEGFRVMIADLLAWLYSFSRLDHSGRGRRDHSMAQIVLPKIWSPLAGVPDTYI